VREHQLALLVLLVFNVNFHLVTHLQVWCIAEFAARNDTVALVTDVDNDFAVVDGCNCTVNHFVVVHVVQCAFIGCLVSCLVGCLTAILEFFPIEIFQRIDVLNCHKCFK